MEALLHLVIFLVKVGTDNLVWQIKQPMGSLTAKAGPGIRSGYGQGVTGAGLRGCVWGGGCDPPAGTMLQVSVVVYLPAGDLHSRSHVTAVHPDRHQWHC
uniref:Uncharacterized protein n=1 Tax=Pyxicephalus adspersus TaxID=30357 RepID=A0AAV3AYT0_PYXAD|nr:TPA: hypothetical protein GDO54_011541 [Pyxicephalus adspersus]